MITLEQIKKLTKEYKINESVIYREYLQLIFLSYLYNESFSKDIYFKGGTAIHLLFQAPRFSEDLDFTAEIGEKELETKIAKVFKIIEKSENISFKPKKSLAGKRFLLTGKYPFANFKVFINLDFSFREKVLDPQSSILETKYPVLFTSFIKHLSKKELLAEKIRAVLHRKKPRDIYDLWFLSKDTLFDQKLLDKKLSYYQEKGVTLTDIRNRIETFSDSVITADLKPFIPLNDRPQLAKFAEYIKVYLLKKFS